MASLEALSRVASAAEPIAGREEENGTLRPDGTSSSSVQRPLFPPSCPPSGNGNPPITTTTTTTTAAMAAAAAAAAANNNANNRPPIDWARLVTVEERKYIRDKIKNAYQRKAPTYDDLLDVCSAIEEEFVFASVPSRLDYFKSGVQYEKRVHEKLSSLRTTCGVGAATRELEQSMKQGSSDDLKSLKRAKTQH